MHFEFDFIISDENNDSSSKKYQQIVEGEKAVKYTPFQNIDLLHLINHHIKNWMKRRKWK